jgi:hypothetical protein
VREIRVAARQLRSGECRVTREKAGANSEQLRLIAKGIRVFDIQSAVFSLRRHSGSLLLLLTPSLRLIRFAYPSGYPRQSISLRSVVSPAAICPERPRAPVLVRFYSSFRDRQ